MRGYVALALVVSVPARAEVSVGASVGAGAQGAATYGALDLRLDAAWPDVYLGGRSESAPLHIWLGLGARGVWDDAEFRRSDWSGPESVLTLVRDFEITRDMNGTLLALAVGGLAPARIGHVVDGYRAALDDRFHTGVRAAARNEQLDIVLELDDMLDPALAAGGVRYAMAPPWSMYIAFASDPRAPAMRGAQTVTALEAGVGRRVEGDRARADVGVAVIAEISLGASATVFGNAALERAGVTWTARADVRAGTGSAGSLFGPLYRIERLAHDGRASLWDRAKDGDLAGANAGFAVGATLPAGWLEVGARARAGLGGIGFASAGAPMGKWVQAGMWAAIGEDDAAGAGELRVAWAKRLFSALQVARIYRLDAMEPSSLWSVTAWFGAASE